MADAQAPHHYKFNVTMSCSGCSGAVERVLKKMDGLFLSLLPLLPIPLPFPLSPHSNHDDLTDKFDGGIIGIKSYNVSLETQTADVYADEEVGYEAVLEKIKKTGKTVVKGERDGVEAAV